MIFEQPFILKNSKQRQISYYEVHILHDKTTFDMYDFAMTHKDFVVADYGFPFLK